MNGIEKITARIAAEAAAGAKSITDAARAEAETIRADYEKKAKLEYDKCLREGRERIEQGLQRDDNTAHLEAKKEILALKWEMIDRAYARAREMILGLPEDKYVAFLTALAGRASVSGDEEVLFSEADRSRVGSRVVAGANELIKSRGLAPRLTLSEKTRPISGGLVLRKGDVEINCALDSLIDMSRSSLDAEIAAVLFG